MEYRVVSLNPSSLSVVSWKKKNKKKNTSEKLFILIYMHNVCGSFRYSYRYYMHKVQKMYFTVLLLLPQEKYSLQDELHY